LKSTPLYYDQIRNRIDVVDGQLPQILLELELNNFIRQLAGNRYISTLS